MGQNRPSCPLFSCQPFRPGQGGGHLLRLIHMLPSTDTNTTSSSQWSYLYKNIISLAIILILKHVLSRLMQKYLSPVINCLLCCMNWYSWGVICSSHRIRAQYTFASYSYGSKIYQPYVGATVPMHS